jgi:hypothetical protein
MQRDFKKPPRLYLIGKNTAVENMQRLGIYQVIILLTHLKLSREHLHLLLKITLTWVVEA